MGYTASLAVGSDNSSCADSAFVGLRVVRCVCVCAFVSLGVSGERGTVRGRIRAHMHVHTSTESGTRQAEQKGGESMQVGARGAGESRRHQADSANWISLWGSTERPSSTLRTARRPRGEATGYVAEETNARQGSRQSGMVLIITLRAYACT